MNTVVAGRTEKLKKDGDAQMDIYCNQPGGATYCQWFLILAITVAEVVEAVHSNALYSTTSVKQPLHHLPLPYVTRPSSRKCSRKQNVIVNRLERRKVWRLRGRVYEAEDIVEDVVASAILLEVESLSEAHGPL